jgi:hypothetical protein
MRGKEQQDIGQTATFSYHSNISEVRTKRGSNCKPQVSSYFASVHVMKTLLEVAVHCLDCYSLL